MMTDEEKCQEERAGKKPYFYFPAVTSETEEDGKLLIRLEGQRKGRSPS